MTDLAEVLAELPGFPTCSAGPPTGAITWSTGPAAQFDGLGPLNDRAARGQRRHPRDERLRPANSPSWSCPSTASAPASCAPPQRGEIEAIAVPDAVHRLPGALARHHHQRHRQRRLAVRHASGPVAAPAGRTGIASRRPSTRPSASRARSAASPGSPRSTPIVGGVDIPAGSRVLVSFASANRDERRWDEPDRFDITRESAGQLAFGHGEHACVGMGLARLEGAAVLVRARRAGRDDRAGRRSGPQAQQPHPLVQVAAGHRDPNGSA